MKNYILLNLIISTFNFIYASEQKNTIVIKLNINTVTRNKIIYIEDISTIVGTLSKKDIDIAKFPPGETSMEITKEQILFRLKLYNPYYEYVILGPRSIKVYFVGIGTQETKYIVPGEKLNLLYKFNNLEVRTIAEAIERGKVGDVIKFRNIESQKVIYGKIIDEKTAIIE